MFLGLLFEDTFDDADSPQAKLTLTRIICVGRFFVAPNRSRQVELDCAKEILAILFANVGNRRQVAPTVEIATSDLLERPPNVPIAVDSWTIVEIRAAFTWKLSSEQSVGFTRIANDVAIDPACTSCERRRGPRLCELSRISGTPDARKKKKPDESAFRRRDRRGDPSIEPEPRSGQVRFINERTIDTHSDRVGSRRGRSAASGQALERRVSETEAAGVEAEAEARGSCSSNGTAARAVRYGRPKLVVRFVKRPRAYLEEGGGGRSGWRRRSL